MKAQRDGTTEACKMHSHLHFPEALERRALDSISVTRHETVKHNRVGNLTSPERIIHLEVMRMRHFVTHPVSLISYYIREIRTVITFIILYTTSTRN